MLHSVHHAIAVEAAFRVQRSSLGEPIRNVHFSDISSVAGVFVHFLAALHSGPVPQGALWNTVFMVQILKRCVELGPLLQSLVDFLLALLVLCSSCLGSWNGCDGGTMD